MAPSLPIALIARILLYNVGSIQDVAQMRLVGKAVGREAVSSCRIACPGRGAFVERLLSIDWKVYKGFEATPGEYYEVSGHDAFLIASDEAFRTDVAVRVVGQPKLLYEATDSKHNTKVADFESSETEYLEKLAKVCDSILKATKVEELIADDSEAMAFLKPPLGSDTTVTDTIQAEQGNKPEYDGSFSIAVPAMITFGMDPTEPYIQKTLRVGNDKFYQINMARSIGDESFDEDFLSAKKSQKWAIQPLFEGGQAWAVDVGPVETDSNLRMVNMLLYLMIDEFGLTNDGVYKAFSHRFLLLTAFWDEHQKRRLVEGVVIVDDFINAEFQQRLQEQVDALARKQEQDMAVDYHPHSNQVVRDLVHPALYSYIQNVTPLIANVKDVEPVQIPVDTKVVNEPGKDFWGRPYETSQYQWLPSYVSISAEGKCSFDTYINNLTPRDNPVHSALYSSLEALLGQALPFIESVLSYVYAVRPILPCQDHHWEGVYYPSLASMDMNFISLCGQTLQVITKIVDYELSDQHDAYEGVWHVEGMSHEEIVLTCLYILDRDETIEGGEIEFKRSFLIDEAYMIMTKVAQCRPFHFDVMMTEGMLPLGTVATPAGRLVVFPNSHIHRVKAMKQIRRYEEDDQRSEKRSSVISKRRIVVFFVVNPQKRIVPTREVAPQQMHSGGKLSHEEALEHRLQLMTERKFKKQDWNVRKVELCEH